MIPYIFIVNFPHFLLIFLKENTDNIYIDRQCADLIFLLYFSLFIRVFLPIWLNSQLKFYYKENKSISFLTLFISNLPKKWKKEELKDFLQKKALILLGKNLEIAKITCFQHSENLEKIQRKIQKNLAFQRKLKKKIFEKRVSQSRKSRESFEIFEGKYEILQKKIQFYHEEGRRIMGKSGEIEEIYQKFAFVILENNEIKKLFINKWPNNWFFAKKRDFSFKNHKILIKSAPDFNDINVKNLGKSSFLLRILVIFIAFLIIMVFYLIISLFKNIFTDKFFGSFLMLFFNKIIEKIFLFLSKKAKFQTFTKFERFSLNLIGFFQFLNTFLMALIHCNFLGFFIEFFSAISNRNLIVFEDFFNEFIQYFTRIFFFIVLIPLAHLLNFSQMLRYFQRFRVEKGKLLVISQKKLNKIWENAPLQIIEFYFDFDYIYLISVFMWSFYPIWVFLTIFAFFMLYWMFKYLLLRLFTIKKQRSEKTFFNLINIIRKGPLLFSISLLFINIKNLFFFNNLRLFVCSWLIFSVFLLEFLGNFGFFCDTRYFKGLNFKKSAMGMEEVKGQENDYNLFESIDFEGEKEEFEGLELEK